MASRSPAAQRAALLLGSPEGAGPTAVGQSPAGAGPIATEVGGISGETGRGEAAVPVEVGLERSQPDQPGKAGELGVYLLNRVEFDDGLVCLPRAWLTSTPRRLAG